MAKEKPKTPSPTEDAKKPAKLPKANDRTSADPAGTDPESDSTESTSGEQQRPDFGGLPDRNLKKNLGCG